MWKPLTDKSLDSIERACGQLLIIDYCEQQAALFLRLTADHLTPRPPFGELCCFFCFLELSPDFSCADSDYSWQTNSTEISGIWHDLNLALNRLDYKKKKKKIKSKKNIP